MTYEERPNHKRSLGALRKVDKTKPRSPDCTGPIKLQRHTRETFVKQFEQTEVKRSPQTSPVGEMDHILT